MKSLKKKLQNMAKLGLAIFGPVVMFKASEPLVDRAVDAGRDYISMKQDIPDIRGQIDENMPQKDRERFEQLLDVMAKTPRGRELIRTLGTAGTQLSVVEAFEGSKAAGQATGIKKIEIVRDCLHTAGAVWTMAHEMTHVQNKLNFNVAPQTLDDAHILNTIDESLAERNGFIVSKEVMQADPSFMTPEEYVGVLENQGLWVLEHPEQLSKRTGAQFVFDKRMKNSSQNTDWVRSYESQSKETRRNALMNTILSDTPALSVNPNWDQVVQKMTAGEVKSISELPIPTWRLVGDMIVDANAWGDGNIDLSCAERHRQELLDGNDFKLEVFSRIKDLAYWLHADENTQILDVFKDLMPESYAQSFVKGGWIPSLENHEEGKVFLAEQTNQGYLQKALKVLQNPMIVGIKEKDEGRRAGIEETELILSAYNRLFFEKGNKNLALNQGRLSSNLQL